MSSTAPPVFITRFSLSSRTAIGVQTKLLLEPLKDWRHLFWSASEFAEITPHSLRMESLPFSRMGILKRKTVPARLLQGLSWWKDDQLKPQLRRRLHAFLGQKIGMIYAAPLDLHDARRMKAVLEEIGRPFVLHLWDLLDQGQLDASEMKWLIANAQHVFSITQEIADAISLDRERKSLLRCTRLPSQAIAAPPVPGVPLRIVMIGDCGSYASGMNTLDQGVQLARQRGLRTQLVYIGRERGTLGWRQRLHQPLEVSGFLESDNDRDTALAGNQIAFLPGPQADPQVDPRSRFSIPSRSLDFMATGLPILGTVHPQSATAHYLKSLGTGTYLSMASSEDLASALLALSDSRTWESASRESLTGFRRNREEKNSFVSWMTGNLSSRPTS